MIKPYYHARKKKHLKNIQNMSQYHKATFIQNLLKWQKFNKNILETDLLNLSNPEKSVVSAGKLCSTSAWQ